MAGNAGWIGEGRSGEGGKGSIAHPRVGARAACRSALRVGLPRSHANAPRGAMRTERILTMALKKRDSWNHIRRALTMKRGGLHLA